MIPLFTPAQVRDMDERTIGGGTDSLELMERAAGHLARATVDLGGRSYGLRVVLACGKGNNGGDGLAAARRLQRMGAQATVVLLADPDELSGDAAVQLRRWRGMGGRTARDLDTALTHADVAVDCLLGTGAAGAPRPPYDAAVDALNASGLPMVACDVPSGVDAGTGAVEAQAVHADVTVTLGAHKRGLALWPARGHVGRPVVGEIGVRRADDDPDCRLFEADDVLATLPEPSDAGDKRRRGVVVIVAGSSDMSGAAALSARGALAAGVGLVTVATTPLARHLIAPTIPSAMTVDLPEDDPDAAFARIAEVSERADAVAIGPGLGHDEPQVALVRRCLDELTVPIVLDADGINAFRHDAKALAAHATPTLVVTPHRSELARVLDADEDDLWPRRIDVVPELARSWDATVVAKGPGSITAAPDGRVWINATGNAALATGGTGDVLTGMTVAALGGGTDPVRVAATVALHGLAGEVAAERGTRRSVSSADVADAVPHALRRLRDGRP